MRGESLLFVRRSASQPAFARLAFTPTSVHAMRSADGARTFVVGRDFLWTAGQCEIEVPVGSAVPSLLEAELYPPRGSQKYGTCRDRECDLLYGEADDFHRLQCAIDYDHNIGNWPAEVPASCGGSLPRFAKRLQEAQPVLAVILGDSISVGMNSSQFADVPPYQPGYAGLLPGRIRRRFGSRVELHNLSVSGKTMQWGGDRAGDVAGFQPDLVVLAFGMNDATAGTLPKVFARHLREIVTRVRAISPHVEFILLSTSSGNPEWSGTRGELYRAYRAEMLRQAESGCVLADVTTVWDTLVRRKKYVDLTGNGLNHPCDFAYRVYADVLIHTISRSVGSTCLPARF